MSDTSKENVESGSSVVICSGCGKQTNETKNRKGILSLLRYLVRCRWLRWHKYYVIKHYSWATRKVGCYHCDKTWGMNDRTRSLVEWDSDLQEYHEGTYQGNKWKMIKKENNCNFQIKATYHVGCGIDTSLDAKIIELMKLVGGKWYAQGVETETGIRDICFDVKL